MMKKIIVLSLSLFVCYLSNAQVLSSANDITDQYIRARNLITGEEDKLYRDLTWFQSDSMDFLGSSPKSKQLGNFYLHPISLDVYVNTTYAKSFNNGAVWSGNGITSALQGGFSYKKGGLEVTVLPIVFSAQNEPFDTVGIQHDQPVSSFAYPWGNGEIDLPQRFGDGTYDRINLGQSKIQYTFKNKLYVRVSNESMWWGPTYMNPSLMSNNAAGIPHLGFGSDEKLRTKIGSFDFNVYWGALFESDFFNFNSDDDRRYFTAMNFTYEPSFVTGLELGLARSFQRNWRSGDLEWQDFFAALADPENRAAGNNSTYDQIATAFVRWRYPSVGFEVFADVGRYDWGGDLKNVVIQDPEHTLIYSIGFAKLFPVNEGNLRFLTEFNVLSKSRLAQSRIAPTLYHHFAVEQGYTNYGEVIGASTGPGSTNQLFKVDVYKKNCLFGAFLQRTTFNDDEFFAIESSVPFADRDDNLIERDVEASLGAFYYRNWNKIQIGLDAIFSVRDNFNLRRNQDVTNLYLNLKVKRAF